MFFIESNGNRNKRRLGVEGRIRNGWQRTKLVGVEVLFTLHRAGKVCMKGEKTGREAGGLGV